MIWLYLILTYNILFLLVYFGIIVWLGGAKFSFKEMFIDWIVSPYLFYEVIKDFSIGSWFLIQEHYRNIKYKIKHGNNKQIYDPYLNKMITIRKTS